ncbi:YceI family protein [Caulobacter sp. NIBR2454]|uniref:YceI family protein n=1 Tax=Caulobacter sp. NIBR2454 TaxID=3015996 RepID=UPI0022B66751|nr:YceI family protein [Caulobacter sp. NIBR2454]
MIRAAVLALAATAVLAGPALAAPDKNPAAAPSGDYKLDSRHAALIARVGHMGGVSKSVFRFNTLSGTLKWNAQDPTKSSLSVAIDPKSITTNVAGFAEELSGEKFMKTAQFPQITFVSKSITMDDADEGKVTGDLTFMGVTKPVTLDVDFNGSVQSRGAAKLGFEAEATIKRSEFGLTAAPSAIGEDIEIQIDIEFDQIKPAA